MRGFFMRKTIRLYVKLLVLTGIAVLSALFINIGTSVSASEPNLYPRFRIESIQDLLFSYNETIQSYKTKAKIEEIKRTEKILDDKRKAEAERVAEEKRKAEEAKRLEEERKAREEEERRQAEQEELIESHSWQTGIASAYGGWSDAQISSNARTATGEAVTESSMGVAIPISWGRSDLYGHKVLIKYKGEVVEAKINDCGGMGGGSRALDLQPGVFKAFGFKSCDSWGLREVQYSIL